MQTLFPIEAYFKKMCETSPINKYFYEKYILFKHLLLNDFYNLIRESKPGFTDHSHNHISNVLNKMNSLCLHKVKHELYDDPEHIKIFELYLLLMSVIFHDVAMIVEKREKHSDLKKILDLFDSVILSDDEREWIQKIVKCHQSSTKIEEVIAFDNKMVMDYVIHPQFLAAMLRLADELDESKLRANVIGLKTGKIRKNQIIYHEISKVFDGIKPDYNRQAINIEISTQKGELYKKYLKGKKQVIFFEEIVNKIEKINDERKYCMRFNKYFLEYRVVHVSWFIKDGDRVIKKVEFVFDDNKDKHSFLKEKSKEFARYRR